MPRNRPPRRYRLNVEALSDAARAHGDERQLDISKRTGIDKGVVSRLHKGRDLSLYTLLTLSSTYGVSATDLAIPYLDHEQEAA